MSEARSAMSGLHSQRTEWEMLLSQLPCGHPDKTVSCWHSVDSTNYTSLPEVQSQGQGRGSVANGLLSVTGYCSRWPKGEQVAMTGKGDWRENKACKTTLVWLSLFQQHTSKHYMVAAVPEPMQQCQMSYSKREDKTQVKVDFLRIFFIWNRMTVTVLAF